MRGSHLSRPLIPTILAAIALSAAATSPAAGAPPTGNPQIDAAVSKAVAFIKANMDRLYGGRRSLAALALLKAGEPADSPHVLGAIKAIQDRIVGGKYNHHGAHEHIYSAGVELMVLANADPVEYRPEMEAILQYVLSAQSYDGFWDYLAPTKKKQVGDTSQVQYALLGMWAAARSNIAVPQEAWERAAGWLIGTQQKDGGFTYRPGSGEVPGSSVTMTAAGTGNLMIVRRHLFPDEDAPGGRERKKPPKAKHGVLEPVDLDGGGRPAGKKKADARPSVSMAAIDGSVRRGLGWFGARFTLQSPRYPMYYFYALERMGALTETDIIGGQDWYEAGAAYLLKRQQADGSWASHHTDGPTATSFGVLFLVRATGTITNGVGDYGGGLLRGGEGLEIRKNLRIGPDGKPVQEEVTDPLEKLLEQLETAKIEQAAKVEQLSRDIVEIVQLSDREKFLQPGMKPKLLRMAQHVDPDVRRVAIWALGRTGSIDVAGVVFDALENDPDYDVAVEADNALCWIARRPQGIELPPGVAGPPDHGLPENAAKQKRVEAIRKWRRAAADEWRKWYFRVRPYDERDDLKEIQTRK